MKKAFVNIVALSGLLFVLSGCQSPDPAPPGYSMAPPVQPISVEDIKAMSRAHVSDANIIRQIDSTHTVYHLDTSAIIDLSNSGVSQLVISHMISTGGVVTTQAPPPPRAETVVVAPGPAYVWIGGEWIWGGASWVWVSGRWAIGPHPHAVWIGPRWVHGPHGWHRTPGRWR